MTNEAFLTVLESRIDAMRATLASKAKEYATGADRLHNFKRAAVMQECDPAEALIGMLTKHLVSIFDMVSNKATHGLPAVAVINEKIGDAVNYLVLLEALLKESPDGGRP